MQEVRQLAEQYVGAEIPPFMWDVVLDRAKRKLSDIIQRFGDEDGERRQPYYLAQLIAEAVRAEALTALCILKYEEKRNACVSTDASQKQPHYSRLHGKSQQNVMEV